MSSQAKAIKPNTGEDMSTNISSTQPLASSADAVAFLLKKAKLFHRAAQSKSVSNSLPILRRLINSRVLINVSLVELNKQKIIIKRKHILQLFAIEAGFKEWSAYRHSVEKSANWKYDDYLIALTYDTYPNLWFSTLDEAIVYATENGGRAIKAGKQAMVIVD